VLGRTGGIFSGCAGMNRAKSAGRSPQAFTFDKLF
jgi:hypothetical protein